MKDLADVEMSWGDRLRSEGREQGLELGIEQGVKKGEQKMLLHLLSLMFGELPDSLVARITAIEDEDMLAMIAKQILTIKQLDQLVLPDSEKPEPHLPLEVQG